MYELLNRLLASSKTSGPDFPGRKINAPNMGRQAISAHCRRVLLAQFEEIKRKVDPQSERINERRAAVMMQSILAGWWRWVGRADVGSCALPRAVGDLGVGIVLALPSASSRGGSVWLDAWSSAPKKAKATEVAFARHHRKYFG